MSNFRIFIFSEFVVCWLHMSIDVHVSAILRSRCGGKGNFSIEGDTVRALARAIDGEYPGFAESVLQPDGSIQSKVLVSINGELLQSTMVADTAVKPGDKVFFLSAIAGG
jgi:molybdopterin converting factor small subunit